MKYKIILSMLLFAGNIAYAEVATAITQHTWPTWGNKQIITQLSNQRDEILYIHDQTLHLANLGYTPDEIAATIKLPDELYKYGYEPNPIIKQLAIWKQTL